MVQRAQLIVVLAAGLATGCGMTAAGRRSMVAPFQPANVQSAAPRLPDSVRRVAVLPVCWEGTGSNARTGADVVRSSLARELGKLRAFEAVWLSTEQLHAWTGQTTLGSREPLPAGLFERIRDLTAADAVLFVEVTEFHAYPPLALGLNLRLVDARSQFIWWSVDEVFDGGSVAVAKAATAYAARNLDDPRNDQQASSVLLSPSRFSQYALHSCLETMPDR